MNRICQGVDGPDELRVTLPRFDHVAAKSLQEACQLLTEHHGARAIAGGTDILAKLRRRAINTSLLVGLKHIAGLDRIEIERTRGLTLGATVLLADIAMHPEIARLYPAVAAAARHTATVQIRNMGTIGGNICNASPCADNVPALIALDAEATIVGPSGEPRSSSLAEMFQGPGSTTLQPGELLAQITVGPPLANTGVAYERISARGRVDLSAVSVAVRVTLDGHKCAQARIVLGSVAPTVMRATSAELLLTGADMLLKGAMINQTRINEDLLDSAGIDQTRINEDLLDSAGIDQTRINEDLLDKVARQAAAESRPISDVRATAEYRREMVAVLTKRALRTALARACEDYHE